ncbi:MAG: hypothetical protein KKF78_01560 [Candidatus Omnitrophica bacterium]|nr:hypothetical protein [Candidatus Omnitrophota bacterium]MBU1995822.1 hypothetical protein [Candidatus Omnitrophota bacterium]
MQVFMFSVTAFLPICIFMLIFGTGVIMLPVYSILMNDLDSLGSSLSLIGFVLLAPISVMYVCYLFCRETKSWVKRKVYMYLAWLFLSFLASYTLAGSLGGVSMAVVDGGASNDRFLDYAYNAVIMVIFGHLIFVPWIFLAARHMKKNPEKYFK